MANKSDAGFCHMLCSEMDVFQRKKMKNDKHAFDQLLAVEN